jgi:hypothetical protein
MTRWDPTHSLCHLEYQISPTFQAIIKVAKLSNYATSYTQAYSNFHTDPV